MGNVKTVYRECITIMYEHVIEEMNWKCEIENEQHVKYEHNIIQKYIRHEMKDQNSIMK